MAAPRAPAISRSGTRAKVAASTASTRRLTLFFARPQEPLPEGRRGLDNPASYKVGVRVEDVCNDGEKPSDGLRLLVEDPDGHFIAGLGVGPDFGPPSPGTGRRHSVMGYLDSQYGRRFRSIPVGEATLSASPINPQLQVGTAWSPSRSPSIGTYTCPSSPAVPVAPLMMRPWCTSPPPNPLPTITETEERSFHDARNAADGRRGRQHFRRCGR